MLNFIKNLFKNVFGIFASNSNAEVANILALIRSHEDECEKSIDALITGNVKFQNMSVEQKADMVKNCVQTGVNSMGLLKDLNTLKADVQGGNYVQLIEDVMKKFGK